MANWPLPAGHSHNQRSSLGTDTASPALPTSGSAPHDPLDSPLNSSRRSTTPRVIRHVTPSPHTPRFTMLPVPHPSPPLPSSSSSAFAKPHTSSTLPSASEYATPSLTPSPSLPLPSPAPYARTPHPTSAPPSPFGPDTQGGRAFEHSPRRWQQHLQPQRHQQHRPQNIQTGHQTERRHNIEDRMSPLVEHSQGGETSPQEEKMSPLVALGFLDRDAAMRRSQNMDGWFPFALLTPRSSLVSPSCPPCLCAFTPPSFSPHPPSTPPPLRLLPIPPPSQNPPPPSFQNFHSSISHSSPQDCRSQATLSPPRPPPPFPI